MAADVHFEMIQQEIYLLKNLVHPRIISLYAYFYSNDGKYIHIVMEYAEHGSLSKLIGDKILKNQRFNENVRIHLIHTISIYFNRQFSLNFHSFFIQEIKNLFIEIVSGMEFLHMKNVVHKDIKSDNILICDNGHLKIADFGVSKITNMYVSILLNFQLDSYVSYILF